MDTYQIKYEKNPQPQDLERLGQGIDEYARKMRALSSCEAFSFFIRDQNNQIKGGLNGVMFYGCLYIDQLWVDESLRGKNYGTQLMRAAEKLGHEKKCLFASVNTMDWEARVFYEKLGYYVEFERHGFEKNSIFYFLRKDF